MTAALPLPTPYVTVPPITDWSRVVAFRPDFYGAPASEAELRAMIAAHLAKPAPRGSLRFLGGLHSCSDTFVGDSVIDCSQLPQTLVWDADNGAVVASGNWHLHDFLLAVAAKGKSLTATGGTDAQTLAGLIATNTAGATATTSIYELVDWIDFLTVAHDGVTLVDRRITAGTPEFDAAICSLGALGYLLRVRFRLVDELFFAASQTLVSLESVLADPFATTAKHPFWRIEWLPTSFPQRGLFWTCDPIPRELADPDGDYPIDGDESILSQAIGFTDKFLHAGALMDHALAAAYEVLVLTFTPVTATGPLRTMLPVDRLSPLAVAQAEWAFDPADIMAAIAAIKAYCATAGWPNLPIEIELTRTDSYYMSSWNWPGLAAVAKFNFQYLTDYLTAAEQAAMLVHLEGLWDHLVASGLRFKGHWGKLNFMTTAMVAKNYDTAAFVPFVQPAFVNDYLRGRIPGLPV